MWAVFNLSPALSAGINEQLICMLLGYAGEKILTLKKKVTSPCCHSPQLSAFVETTSPLFHLLPPLIHFMWDFFFFCLCFLPPSPRFCDLFGPVPRTLCGGWHLPWHCDRSRSHPDHTRGSLAMKTRAPVTAYWWWFGHWFGGSCFKCLQGYF